MIKHRSDCAMHDSPAIEPSKCDCGALKAGKKSRSSSRHGAAGIPASGHQMSYPTVLAAGYGRANGLELPMVYGFVKQSGGPAVAYSEEGEITAVKLDLPRSRKKGKHHKGAAHADVPKAQGETVMVVEDDPEVRTLSVALLRRLGYQILEAADGSSALKAVASAPKVNLLFTDVVLPGGMSGPQLATEVQDRFPGIAVLYTSGYTDLANVDQSAFCKDIELLKKPYRKAELARKIRRALDQTPK